MHPPSHPSGPCCAHIAALTTMVLNNLPIGGSLSADWRLPPNFQFMLFQNTSLNGSLPNGWDLPPLQSIQLMNNQARTGAAHGLLGGGMRDAVGKPLHVMPTSPRPHPPHLQLTGTIPKEFCELGSLIFLSERAGMMCCCCVATARLHSRCGAAGPASRPANRATVLPFYLACTDLEENKLSGPVPDAMAFNTSWDAYGLSAWGNNFSGARCWLGVLLSPLVGHANLGCRAACARMQTRCRVHLQPPSPPGQTCPRRLHQSSPAMTGSVGR